MTYPIPRDVLDDRLAWVGTSGYGKTYNASAGIEHVLARKHRVVISDPLDVWWGLRLASDGKTPSPFDVVIFGGKHADLPVTRHAGAVIGETVATMRESCIVSLGTLGSASERRLFMLDFLEALYHHTNADKVEPYHVVFDEADLWAPQKPVEEEHKRLQSRMEEIVRRGRVRGFIPWLITQRPAVLSKDVLSQADGLISFKLTSSQDRDALGAWVEGQADREDWRKMRAALPTLERGTGVIWIPGASILKTAQFPPKATFDSSKTPKRGERREARELRPLDVETLKGKLSTVETEAKANDPKLLKAEIGKLKAEIGKLSAAKPANAPAPDNASLERERQAGYDLGRADQFKEMREAVLTAVGEHTKIIASEAMQVINAIAAIPAPKTAKIIPQNITTPRSASVRSTGFQKSPSQVIRIPKANGSETGLSRPQTAILESLMWWNEMGHPTPTRVQVAVKAGMKASGGHFKTRLSELSTRNLIAYQGPDRVALTSDGIAAAPAPDTGETVVAAVRSILSDPQRRIFDAMRESGGTHRSEIAAIAGMDATGGHFKTRLSELSSLGIVTYPDSNSAALQDWLSA